MKWQYLPGLLIACAAFVYAVQRGDELTHRERIALWAVGGVLLLMGLILHLAEVTR